MKRIRKIYLLGATFFLVIGTIMEYYDCCIGRLSLINHLRTHRKSSTVGFLAGLVWPIPLAEVIFGGDLREDLGDMVSSVGRFVTVFKFGRESSVE